MRLFGSLFAVFGIGAFFVSCSNHDVHEGHQESRANDVEVLPAQEGPWNLIPATDENPDPDIVEIKLEAKISKFEYRDGKTVDAWLYNASMPGPLIEAKVGDRVIVHFKNSLPEPTTVHWHGLRIPAAMDGTLAMQNPIQPSSSLTYDFVVQDEGFFWFHPHMHTDEQVGRGLVGAILVKGTSDELIKPSGEKLIVLNDLAILDDKIVLPADMMSLMNGREGNHVFANGKVRPVLDVAPNETYRLRIVNASSARFYKLRFPGQVQLIGTDGHLLEGPQNVTDVQMVPGERVDLMVTFEGEAGQSLDVLSIPYDRGHGVTGGEFPVFSVKYSEDAPRESAPLPQPLATFAPLPQAGSIVRLELTEDPMDHGGDHGGHGGDGPIFRINGEAFPNITPIQAKLGDTQDWVIFNNSEMDHPFHLHGFFFEVLESDKRSVNYRARKDTVNVLPDETLKIRIHFDGYAGEWMYHCHILEHEERGMMGQLTVVE